MLSCLVRSIVGAAADPLDGVRERLVVRGRQRVVVLIYHRVGGRSPSPVDLPGGVFEHHLDVLAESGRVVDLDTAAAVLTGRPAELAAGPYEREDDEIPRVVITFDDGTADWPDVVMPALVARGLPATFYVSTDFVDRQRLFPDEGRPVSWAGLDDMAGTGLATIGSHTHTHRVLAGATTQVAAEELDRSIATIEGHLGIPCRHFAYPKAIAPSAAADVVVRRRCHTAALAGNRANVAGTTDLHRLGRHALTVADDDASFARKLAGGMWLEGWLRERRDALRLRPDEYAPS